MTKYRTSLRGIAALLLGISAYGCGNEVKTLTPDIRPEDYSSYHIQGPKDLSIDVFTKPIYVNSSREDYKTAILRSKITQAYLKKAGLTQDQIDIRIFDYSRLKEHACTSDIEGISGGSLEERAENLGAGLLYLYYACENLDIARHSEDRREALSNDCDLVGRVIDKGNNAAFAVAFYIKGK